MPLAFEEWKQRLLVSAGDASPSVRNLGDYVLELLWTDGCEATLSALLDYSQAVLCEKYRIRASDRDRPLSRASSSSDTARP